MKTIFSKKTTTFNLFREQIIAVKILLFTLLLLFSRNTLYAQIQPVNIATSTYVGNTSSYNADFEKVDNIIHVGGYSDANFPVTNGSIYSGNRDMIYSKIDATTGSTLFATYMGGSASDELLEIQVVGNVVHVLGSTQSSDFPVTNGSTLSGTDDLIYMQLDATTGVVLFSTYYNTTKSNLTLSMMQVIGNEVHLLVRQSSFITNDIEYVKLDVTSGGVLLTTAIGGSFSDTPLTMVVTGGEAHILAFTNSTDYPVTNGSIAYGSNSSTIWDLVYTKINTSNGGILSSSYVGPISASATLQSSNSLELAVVGNEAYIAGRNIVTNYPVTDGSIHHGLTDLIYTKLNTTTADILYSSYIGGTGQDYLQQLTVENNEVHLIGFTTSADFPTTTGLPFGGSADAFYMKLDAVSGTLLTSAFVGGSSNEIGKKMVVAGNEVNILLTTSSTNLPVTNGSTLTGGTDMAYTKLNTFTGALISSTYLGGSDSESLPSNASATGIRKYNNYVEVEGDEVFVVVNSSSTNYPVTNSSSLINGASLVYTRLTNCPTGYTGSPAISPVTQDVCINGVVAQISMDPFILLGSAQPIIYRNGVATEQPSILAKYQWQEAPSSIGPWTNIPGAISKNYSPNPSTIDKYYRRLASSYCNGVSTLLQTGDVASVLVSADIAMTVDAGDTFITCPSVPVTLGGSPTATPGSGAIASYLWTPGGYVTANPTVSPTESTIYTVLVTDTNGCQQIDQTNVQVYTANAGPDVSVCDGTPVKIGTSQIPISGITYSWSPTTGLDDPTLAQPMANPTGVTTYTLTLTIPVTGGGTCSTTDDVVVTPTVAPTGLFAGPDVVICKGDTATLGTAAQAGYTYIWSPGNYLSTNNQATTTFDAGIFFPSPNPFTYYVNASKDGCSFVDEVKVYVLSANAGADRCGPTIIGTPDTTPNINETYEWTVVSGTGNFLGATNTPQVAVGPSTGTSTTYRLTVTFNGYSCTDDVVVLADCGCQTPLITVNASTFSCPDFNLNGGNISLTASYTPYYTYTWTTTGGVTLSSYTGHTVYLTNSAAGMVTVTGTNAIDNSISCSDTIFVNDPAWSLPIFNAQDVATCPGMSIQIGDNPVAGYSYQWDNTISGLNDYSISNPIATVNTTTTFTVIITDISSGCSMTKPVKVSIDGLPNNIAGNDFSLCGTATGVQLGGTAVPDVTYLWTSTPAGAIFLPNNTVANPTVDISSTTTFTLVATNTVTGCSITDAITVNVNTPVPPFSFTNATFCPSTVGAIQLPAGPPGMASYSWSPSNLVLNNTFNGPIATTLATRPQVATTYTLTVTNASGCTGTASITLIPESALPDAGYDQSMCLSDGSILLGNASNPIGAGITYQWSPTTGLSDPISPNPIFTPTVEGTTTYTLSKTEGSCTTTDMVTVAVNNFTLPSMSYPAVCQDTPLQIGPAPIAGASYFWSPSTGLSNPNIANPIATLSSTTIYTLTAVGVNGCIATQTVIVNVVATPAPTIVLDDITACLGTNPVLNPIVSPSGQPYSYSWSPDDGTLSNVNSATPSVILTAVGTKTYNLIVTNTATGCSSNASVNVITINEVPATPIVTSVAPTCLAEEVSTINNYDASNTYTFNPAGPTIDATGLISGMTTGTSYTVTVNGRCTSVTSAPFSNATMLPAITQIGVASTNCNFGNLDYSVIIALDGAAPFTATGTGAPGTWTGNIWTSSPIATGTNYTIDFQDANACNILTVSGNAPICADPCLVGTDTDGDGISDLCDLDDDNDGILDTVECPAHEVLFSNLKPLYPAVIPPTGLAVGDRIIKTGALVFGPQIYDMIVEVTDVSLGSGTLTILGGGLVLSNTVPNTNPYAGMKVEFVPTGSAPTVTGTNPAYTPSTIPEWTLLVGDIDGNFSAGFGEVIGSSLAYYPSVSSVGSSLSNLGFTLGVSGFGGPGAGYVYHRPIELDGTTIVPNVTNDYTYSVQGTFTNYTTNNYIFGLTGDQATPVAARAIYAEISNPTICDEDGDGIPNYLDLDSDNDGCTDANEYYNSTTADGGDGGAYGTGSPTVNADGTVTTASYTGNYANVTIATGIQITTAPVNQTIINGNAVTFSVVATATNTTVYTGTAPNTLPDYTHPTATDVSAGLVYQWLENGIPLTNAGIYSGTNTATLTISNVTGLSGNVYTVVITHPNRVCTHEVDATLTATENPSIAITKDGTLNMGTDNIATVGDVITYNFTVENIGDVTLTNVTVTDINAVVTGGPIATLAVGTTDSTTFTATHVLTQADIDAGYVYNLATATGTSPDGNPVTDDSTDPTPCTTCPVDPTCPDCTIVELPNTTVAENDINNTFINTPVSGSVLTNDMDPQDHNQTVTPFSGAISGGTLTLLADGTYTFVPTTDWTGTTSYTYTVCDNGTPQACDTAILTIEVMPNPNDPDSPNDVVANDDTATTEQGTPVVISILTNDFDPNGDTIGTPTIVTPPTNGTFDPATGIYTPNAGFTGTDTFVYQICDDGTPQACDTATVTITVDPTNTTNDTNANDDAYNGDQYQPINGSVLDNDTDPEGNTQTVTSNTQPQNGTVVMNPDGTFTYTPTGEYSGPDSFEYTTCDNGIPQACDTATVYLTVNPANTTVAENDINNTFINTPVSGSVLTNDSDPQGHTQTVTPFNGAVTGGTLVLLADGTYTFTPTTGFVGTTVYTYTVCDSGTPQACATATLTIEVSPIDLATNDVVANDDTATTEQGAPVTINILTNDFDPNGDTIGTPTVVTPPTNGTYDPATGVYTPNAGFTGTDTFVYQICDNGTPVACDTATVTITVNPVNPLNETFANDDAYNGDGPTILGNVLDNDTDPEGNTQTVTSNTQPDYGTVVVNPDGTFVYTPTPGYYGPDSFVYTTCDNGIPQACDTATVYLTVNADPSIIITKDGTLDMGIDGVANVGDVINYVFTVQNTGNVTLTNVTVTDINAVVTGGLIATLAVDATDSTTFTATHILTQADIDAGYVYNLATATGNDPNGNPVTDDSTDPTPCPTCPVDPICPDCTIVEIVQSPAIAIVKEGVFNDNNGDGFPQAGETITYTFTVTNIGNMSLFNVIVTDPLPGIIVTGGPIDLAVGQSDNTTFTATYTITQADIIAGSVENQATASGETIDGDVVDDLSDDNSTLENDPTVVVLEGCRLAIFNAVSPNGDGSNDIFYIQGIECYPKNTVEIYNRWGVKIYDEDGYDNINKVFRGYSDGRVTVNRGELLPTGTYFYIIKYVDLNGNGVDKSGYLYIQNN